MDALSKKGVEFTTAVTSAPSTVMSTSAMMTGVPAIYQSLIYEGFNSKTRKLNTLQSILSSNGYKVLNTIFFPEGRSYLAPMIGDICEDYWPEHLDVNEFWGNENINEILENLLKDKQGLSKPFFLYLNYNCRHDPMTSERVERGLAMLKEQGYLDNTIIIINSDHGYPDPSRNISYTEMRNLGHDLIMTDDNILAPLIFVVPNNEPKVISEPVSLLDIAPTVLDLLDINNGKLDNKHETGKSLKKFIKGDSDPQNEIKRVDNRYIAQNNRLTALRDNRYKYIFDFESQKEFFYDIAKDPLEKKNLTGFDSIANNLEKFRERFKTEEKAIWEHHVSFAKQRLHESIAPTVRNIALVQINNLKIFELCKCAAEELGLQISNVIQELQLTKKAKTNSYDMCIVILEGSNPRVHSTQLNLAKKISSNNLLILNENLSEVSAPKNWILVSAKKFLTILLPKLFNSPRTFFVDLMNALKKIIRLKK
jgi:hypothetical protein